MQNIADPEDFRTALRDWLGADCPAEMRDGAGTGCYAQTRIYETPGVLLEGAENTPEGVAKAFAEISDPEGQQELQDAFEQTRKFALRAARTQGHGLDWSGG